MVGSTHHTTEEEDGAVKRTITVFAIIAACAFGFATGAAAAESDWHYYGPHHGKDYRNAALVDHYHDNPAVRARTEVEVVGSETVPIGFIGARPRLFKGDSLCAQSSDFLYNGSRTGEYIVAIIGDCGTGSYRSWGVSSAYNYNGEYSYYYTFKSPFIND